MLSDAPRRGDGRIPLEMFLGQKRLWAKPENLTRIPPHTECLIEEPFNRMPDADRTDLSMFFLANKGPVRIPGKPLLWVPRVSKTPTEEAPDSAQTPSAPPSPPPSPHGSQSTAPSEHLEDLQSILQEHEDLQSSNDPVGPHIDLPGGKVDPNETLLQAGHRELEEELSPYGLDLRNRVEAALSTAPNGHSRVRLRLSDNCNSH